MTSPSAAGVLVVLVVVVAMVAMIAMVMVGVVLAIIVHYREYSRKLAAYINSLQVSLHLHLHLLHHHLHLHPLGPRGGGVDLLAAAHHTDRGAYRGKAGGLESFLDLLKSKGTLKARF